MGKLLKKIGHFAKTKPSMFILSLVVIMFLGLFATYESLHLTSSPEFCGMCHQDTPHGPGAEYTTWKPTAHAVADVTCIDCHGDAGLGGYLHTKVFTGLYDLYSEVFKSKENKMAVLTDIATNPAHAAEVVPNTRCLYCHSDSYNQEVHDTTVMSFFGVKMRDMDGFKNPSYREQYGLVDIMTSPVASGVAMNHSVHVDDLGLNCVDCHMQVAHSGELFTPTKMETCFTCHDDSRGGETTTTAEMGMSMPSNEDCSSCHIEPLQMQEGKLPEITEIDELPWLMPSITGACESCHYDAYTPPTAQNCVDCHEESYAELFTMYQTDYAAQLAELTPIWKKLVENVKVMSAEESVMFKEFNTLYLAFARDGSKGIHNPDLTTEIYDAALEKGNALLVYAK